MYLKSIIVPATHEYQWQLWPFSLLLWKYWGRDIQIIYYGDKVEGKLPPGVIFRPVPLMRERSEEHWSFASDFGDGFASILRELTDPIVAVSIADFWLSEHARPDKIDALGGYMESHPNVVHAAMGDVLDIDAWSRCVGTWDGMDIMTCSPSDNFNGGLMMNVALWNRELTLELIRNTPVLDSEIMGRDVMLERPDLMSVWVRRAEGMYTVAHTCHRSERKNAHLAHLRKEDIRMVKAFIPEHIHVVEV